MSYTKPTLVKDIQKGLISIIIPIYNTEEAHLRECLDSVLAQTFTNWEAILVNDGSTNDAGKIVDEYSEKDSRFIAIHKKNAGTLLARKTGLENSSGEFIANIDHDDTYFPKFLEKMYDKIKETNADFVWCNHGNKDNIALTENYYIFGANASENVANLFYRSKGIDYSLWNKLIKREIYANVRFPNANITMGEDSIQLLQIIHSSMSAAFISDSLYFHRNGGCSSKINIIPLAKSYIYNRKALKTIFNSNIPWNVTKALRYGYCQVAYYYFVLSLSLNICLFFAGKGIGFPLKIRNRIKNIIQGKKM